jgi:Cu/Ag efflux protein CusF
MITTLSVVAVALAFASVVRAEETATPTPAPAAPAKANTHEATGKITAVDAKAGTLSIKRKNAEVTFTIAKDCKVSLPDKADATVADLKVGDKVTVTYTEEAGAKVAQKIGIPKKHEPKTTGAPK